MSKDSPIERVRTSGDMIYPLEFNDKSGYKVVVKVGESVVAGQKLAEGRDGSCLFSAASGVVERIEKFTSDQGDEIEALVIKNDGKYTHKRFTKVKKLETLSREKILEKIFKAGIWGREEQVGKLAEKEWESIEVIVLTGAETSDALTSNYDRILNYPEELAEGLKQTLRIFPNVKEIVVTESEKTEGIDKLKELSEKKGIVIKTVAKDEKIEKMVGLDVETILAIYYALLKGRPFIERAISVSGSGIEKPSSILVPVGSDLQEIAEYAGKSSKTKNLVVDCTGKQREVNDLHIPVQKTTAGLVCIKKAAEKEKNTSGDITKLLVIGLLPASIFGVYQFGWSALLLILLCTGTAVLTEYLYERGMKKESTISDFSAVATGLLLALNLPSDFPWYLAMAGSVFAILVVKQLFGGVGKNIMNPALGAKCFLLLAFSGLMTRYGYEGITGVTAVDLLRAGESVNTWDLFFGTTAGTIGETSALCLLVGALFLVAMDVISVRIPLSYLGTFILFMVIFGNDVAGMNQFHYICAQVCSGGLLLGAWFMATDYVTAPASKKGQLLYGILLGIITGLFRAFSNSSEGVMYAILFGNLAAPLLDRLARWKPFRKGGIE